MLTDCTISCAWLFRLEAAAAMAVFFFVLDSGGWRYGAVLDWHDPLYLQATTACLAAIVLAQVANLFVCRHPRASTLSLRLRGNRLLVWGVAVELVLLLAIVYTPWGQRVFGTASLSWPVWLFALPFPFVIVAAEEARKALMRRWRKG